MSVKVFYDILNQRSTPAIYTDTIANRPAFGFQGRLFISTDSGQIFEDTGTAWTLVADAGVGGGTLSSVCLNGNTTATGISITAGGLSSNSITNTGNTIGSVLFAGTGGLESQNNTKLFWDNTNFRLGINTATPGAPLDIHGTGTQLQINGTGSSNSYLNFQQAGTSKWRVGLTYSTGANYFDIFDNNSSVSRLSILNSGFIGAGTITPREKLEVAGAVFSTGTNSNLGNFSGVVMDVYNPGTFQTGRIAAYDPAGSCLQLSTNKVGFGSAAALFINKDGQVSVAQDNSGSTNYGSFKVGVDASNMAITWNDLSSGYGYLGTGTGYAYVGTGGQLAFLRNFPPYTGGSIEMARFDLNGNFGLGTNTITPIGSSTNKTLAINAPSGSAAQILLQEAGTRYAYLYGYGADAGFFTNAAIPLLFGTNTSEKMRITGNGEILIGKTTTNIDAADGFRFDESGSMYASIVTGEATYYVRDITNTVYRFYVTGAGTINATNPVISVISDVRLKENITDLEIGLDAIMSLRPRKYDWKKESGNSGKNVRGFIAQEFEQIFPDLIDQSINKTPEGEPYKQIRQDLIPILVKAIQEQQAQIEELKFKINTL